MSAPPLNEIAALLRILSGARIPSLSQAADTAVKLCNAAPNVKSDKAEYIQLATNGCELVYDIAEGLRVKGQKNIDDKLKGSLDDLVGVLEKVLEFAQANAARGDWVAFCYSDAADLTAFREQLEQCLPVFGIQSFTDLQHKANTRPLPKSDNKTTTVNNSGTFHTSNLSHINQCDHGTVNQGDTYQQSMFKGAINFKIEGAEFNNIGRDMNKMNFKGKNVAPNFGSVSSQAFS